MQSHLLLDHIHKISVIDEDGRMTEEEYAKAKGWPLKQVRSQFTATGIIDCKYSSGTAQLTGDGKTLTTCAHIFKDTKTCKEKNRPEGCTFIYRVNGVEKVERILPKMILGNGVKCPRSSLNDDWAILKLKNEIKDVKPYGIPGDFDEPIKGSDLVSISGQTIDFTRTDKLTGKVINPKSIEECEAKFINPMPGGLGAASFESDCDSDHGNSGGSILRIINGSPILVGVTSGLLTHANPNSTNSYVKNVWANTHVSVSGEFLRRLKLSIGR